MKIAIASGKGGTGKTTLSVNFATYLSKTDKHKVVLVDLDVEEPNSGLFLKGKVLSHKNIYKKTPVWDNKKCTFCGKCRTLCNFNAIVTLPNTVLVFPELCHSCFACSELCSEDALPMKKTKIGKVNHININKSFSFVEGILDIGQESAVPLIKKTIAYVEKDYSEKDIIIYDAPPGTSCPVIEVVKDADFVLLITEPTPFGLHDLKIAVQTVQALNKEFAVIINKHRIGNDKVEKYCKLNKIKILAKIPHKKEIALLYSKAKLLYEKIPEVKKELENIYKELLTKQLVSSYE